MDRLTLVQTYRDDILRLAAAHGAYNVRLFRSVARGEAGPDSDEDFLVEMDPLCSLLDTIGLCQELEVLLGCKVDVVTEPALHRLLRKRILREAVPLQR